MTGRIKAKMNQLMESKGKPENFDSARAEMTGSDTDLNNMCLDNIIRRGENISMGCQASARGLAKLA